MSYKCGVCGETLHYRDEVVQLDCNGYDMPDEEHGGSGDFYGVVCVPCYDGNCENIIGNISKYGKIKIEK